MAYAAVKKGPAPAPPVATSFSAPLPRTTPDDCSKDVDLGVVLPGGELSSIEVAWSTPIADVLVLIAAKHKLTPSEHVLSVISEQTGRPVDYASAQPIGSLQARRVFLLSKKGQKKDPPTTVSVTVNLPRGHSSVYKFSSRITVSDVFKAVCVDQDLKPSKYEMQLPGVGPTLSAAATAAAMRAVTLADCGTSTFTIMPSKAVNHHQSMVDISSQAPRSNGMSKAPAASEKKARSFFSFLKRKKKAKLEELNSVQEESGPAGAVQNLPLQLSEGAPSARGSKPQASVRPQPQAAIVGSELSSDVEKQQLEEQLLTERLPSKKKYPAPQPPSAISSNGKMQSWRLTSALAASTPNLTLVGINGDSRGGLALSSSPPVPQLQGKAPVAPKLSSSGNSRRSSDSSGYHEPPVTPPHEPPRTSSVVSAKFSVSVPPQQADERRQMEAAAPNLAEPGVVLEAPGAPGSLKKHRAPVPPSAASPSHQRGRSASAASLLPWLPVFVAPPPPDCPPPSSPSRLSMGSNSRSSSPGSVHRELGELTAPSGGDPEYYGVDAIRTASRNSESSIDTIADVARSFEQAIVVGQNSLKTSLQDFQPAIASFVVGMSTLTDDLHENISACIADGSTGRTMPCSGQSDARQTSLPVETLAPAPSPPCDYHTTSDEDEQLMEMMPSVPVAPAVAVAQIVSAPTALQNTVLLTDEQNALQQEKVPMTAAGNQLIGEQHAVAQITESKAKFEQHNVPAVETSHAKEEEIEKLIVKRSSDNASSTFVSAPTNSDGRSRRASDAAAAHPLHLLAVVAAASDEPGSVRGVKGSVKAVRSKLFDDDASSAVPGRLRFNSLIEIQTAAPGSDGGIPELIIRAEAASSTSSMQRKLSVGRQSELSAPSSDELQVAAPARLLSDDFTVHARPAVILPELQQTVRISAVASSGVESSRAVTLVPGGTPGVSSTTLPSGTATSSVPSGKTASDESSSDSMEVRLRRVAGRVAISSSTTQLFSRRVSATAAATATDPDQNLRASLGATSDLQPVLKKDAVKCTNQDGGKSEFVDASTGSRANLQLTPGNGTSKQTSHVGEKSASAAFEGSLSSNDYKSEPLASNKAMKHASFDGGTSVVIVSSAGNKDNFCNRVTAKHASKDDGKPGFVDSSNGVGANLQSAPNKAGATQMSHDGGKPASAVFDESSLVHEAKVEPLSNHKVMKYASQDDGKSALAISSAGNEVNFYVVSNQVVTKCSIQNGGKPEFSAASADSRENLKEATKWTSQGGGKLNASAALEESLVASEAQVESLSNSKTEKRASQDEGKPAPAMFFTGDRVNVEGEFHLTANQRASQEGIPIAIGERQVAVSTEARLLAVIAAVKPQFSSRDKALEMPLPVSTAVVSSRPQTSALASSSSMLPTPMDTGVQGMHLLTVVSAAPVLQNITEPAVTLRTSKTDAGQRELSAGHGKQVLAPANADAVTSSSFLQGPAEGAGSTSRQKKTIYSLLHSAGIKPPRPHATAAAVTQEPSSSLAADLPNDLVTSPIRTDGPRDSSPSAPLHQHTTATIPAAVRSNKFVMSVPHPVRMSLYTPQPFVAPKPAALNVSAAAASKAVTSPSGSAVAPLPPMTTGKPDTPLKEALVQQYEQLQKEVAAWRSKLQANASVVVETQTLATAAQQLQQELQQPLQQPAPPPPLPAAPQQQQQKASQQWKVLQSKQQPEKQQQPLQRPPSGATLEQIVAEMSKVKLKPATLRATQQTTERQPLPEQKTTAREQLLLSIRARAAQQQVVTAWEDTGSPSLLATSKDGLGVKPTSYHASLDGNQEKADRLGDMYVRAAKAKGDDSKPKHRSTSDPFPPTSATSCERTSTAVKPLSSTLDPREELMIAVRGFGGLVKLRQVSSTNAED